MAHAIDYIDDWEKRLLARLYVQFHSKETWQKWVTEIIAPQTQDLEDAAQTLLSLLDIDECEGTQLDRIGRIVGQTRGASDDAQYRILLKTRVLANRSTGTGEDLYKVFDVLLDGSTFVVTTQIGDIRAFVFRVTSAITAAQAVTSLDFLGDAKEASTRAILQWQETATSGVFTFVDAAFPEVPIGYTTQFDVGLFAGAKEV